MSSSKSTRERILDAALDLIAESPSVPSVGEIATRTGVSRQAIYLHFESKSDLFVAAAQHTDSRHELERHLAPLRAARTAEQLLVRQARFLARYNPLIYPVVRAVDAVRHGDPDLEASWADRLANRRSGCREIAKRLQSWGRLAPGWTVPAAGDWITSQASVKLWEELVIDLGWSSRRYTDIMRRTLSAALLA